MRSELYQTYIKDFNEIRTNKGGAAPPQASERARPRRRKPEATTERLDRVRS
jgi:hypothetical protein